MNRRNLETMMNKLPVIALAATIFAFCGSNLLAETAAGAASGAAAGHKALLTYIRNTEDLIGAAQASGQEAAGSESADAEAKIYQTNCAMCHGTEKQGKLPTFPSLVGVTKRLTTQQITDRIHHGKGMMPPFPNLKDGDLTALLHFLANDKETAAGLSPTPTTAPAPAQAAASHAASGPAAAGGSLFQQNCAFCHGRDTAGGESGPDLTRSRLVAQDKGGDKISEVVRNGRTEGDKKMPAFNFSDAQMADIVAFIHDQRRKAASKPGGRRGVDVSDLQTGNVAAGKKYFEGSGGCSRCHSATGDLAHVASRYQGLQLEERMLYPRNVKSKATVTLPSGETVSGTLTYQDEFTIGVTDGTGRYRSWPVGSVKYSIDAPVEAHVAQFPKYTDADIHNLMAYIQTLR